MSIHCWYLKRNIFLIASNFDALKYPSDVRIVAQQKKSVQHILKIMNKIGVRF